MILIEIKKIIRWFLINIGLRKKKNQVRRDVEIIPIQSKLELLVYWKVLRIGKGPAVILQSSGKEIMKFDFFGKDLGHYHIAPHFEERIYFEEETISEQVERMVIELNMNAQSYLDRQEGDGCGNIRIDQEKLTTAVLLAKKKINYFLQTIPELEDL